ncbi:MAG: hypothetical protein JWN90_34 [Parcubacteria group bacterium]|nr:hypothetical protein [Parcubacteria group bacterium]
MQTENPPKRIFRFGGLGSFWNIDRSVGDGLAIGTISVQGFGHLYVGKFIVEDADDLLTNPIHKSPVLFRHLAVGRPWLRRGKVLPVEMDGADSGVDHSPILLAVCHNGLLRCLDKI